MRHGRGFPLTTRFGRRVPSPPAGGTTPQTLTATVTTSASMTRQVGKVLTATATTTATIVKSVGKGLSATATTTASLIKSVGKTLAATATSTASLAAAKSVLKTLSATATTTATLIKSVGKVLSATATSTATLVRQVGKSLTATATSTATLVRQVGKRLSATATTTASVGRAVAKTLQATATTTASIARSVGKPLSATATTTATLIKSVGKVLTATATSTASLQASRAFLRTLSATVTSAATVTRQVAKSLQATATTTATLIRSVGKSLAATATTTASVVRQVVKTLSATATTTAVLTKTRTALKSLSATATTTASIVRSVGKPLSATATTTASVVRQVAKTLTATATSTASLLAQKAFLKTLTATATSTASLVKSAGKVASATATTTASVVKSAGKRVTATATSTASAIRSVGKLLTGTASSTASLASVSPVRSDPLDLVWDLGGTAAPVQSIELDLVWDDYVPVEYEGPAPSSTLYPGEPPQYPGVGLGFKWDVLLGVPVPVDGLERKLRWDDYVPVEYAGPAPSPDLYPGEPPQYPGVGLGFKWDVLVGTPVPVDGLVLDFKWDDYVPVEYTGPIPSDTLYPGEPPQYPGAGLGFKWDVVTGVPLPVDGSEFDLKWDVFVPVQYEGPAPSPTLYPGEPPQYPGVGLGIKWDVSAVGAAILTLRWDLNAEVAELTHPDLGGVVNEIITGGRLDEVPTGGIYDATLTGGVINVVRTNGVVSEHRRDGQTFYRRGGARLLGGFSDDEVNYEDFAANAAAVNANAARIMVGHDEIELARTANAIAACESLGMQVIVCIWTVTNFMDQPGVTNSAQAAAYYAGRVDACLAAYPNVLVQAFNEPNFFPAFISGYEFTTETAGECLGAAVQAAGPGKMISPPISPATSIGQSETFYFAWMDDMLWRAASHGAFPDLYGIGIHIYPDDSADQTVTHAEVERHITRCAAWGRPVFATEVGYNRGVYGSTQETLSAWTISNYGLDERVGGIFFYRLHSEQPTPRPEETAAGFPLNEQTGMQTALTTAFRALPDRGEGEFTRNGGTYYWGSPSGFSGIGTFPSAYPSVNATYPSAVGDPSAYGAGSYGSAVYGESLFGLTMEKVPVQGARSGTMDESVTNGIVNEVRTGGVVNEVRTGGVVNEVRTGGQVNEVRTGGVPDEVETEGSFDRVLTGGGVL